MRELQTKPANSFAPALNTDQVLQRKCACGQHTMGGGCSDCEKKEGLLQRQVASGGVPGGVPSIVHEVLRSPGQPLDQQTRAFMEPRFSHDFSRVPVRTVAASSQTGLTVTQPGAAQEQEADRMSERVVGTAPGGIDGPRRDFGHVQVHTDQRAAESARAINALAYTVGRDIVFGAGQYAPGSTAGNRLLAHELTHVVQQEGESSPREIKRKVVDNNTFVTCRSTRPGAVATLVAAENQAANMADLAALRIRTMLATHALSRVVGETPGLRNFRDLLWRRFHRDYNRPEVRETALPLLARRFELVSGWINRLNHRYVCRAAGVEPPGDCTTQPGVGLAWTATGINQTALCNGFWTQPAPDDLAETLLHEWFHFGFDFLNDCRPPNMDNTECYDMFAGEIAGTATPADFTACCPAPAGPLPAFTP